MKYTQKILLGGLLAALTTTGSLTAAEIFKDTFVTGTRQNAGWYYGTSTPASVDIVSDETFSSGKALRLNQSSGYVWKSFATQTVTETTSVTFSMSFRDLNGDGIKIGLFNSAGTAAPTSDGTTTAINDDFGPYIQINKTGMSLRYDLGTGTSGVFYGDRSTAESVTYADYGTGLNTLSITIAQINNSFVTTVLLNGGTASEQKLSISTTDSKFASVNEIILSQITTVQFRMSDITVFTTSTIPEPTTYSLLIGGMLSLFGICASKRLRSRLP